jgi:hypothetical protein
VITLKELKEKIIEQVTEIDLIDILGLTTKDIVEAFEDVIEERYAKFLNELELPEEGEDD